jgi:hypothetical protein
MQTLASQASHLGQTLMLDVLVPDAGIHSRRSGPACYAAALGLVALFVAELLNFGTRSGETAPSRAPERRRKTCPGGGRDACRKDSLGLPCPRPREIRLRLGAAA